MSLAAEQPSSERAIVVTRHGSLTAPVPDIASAQAAVSQLWLAAADPDDAVVRACRDHIAQILGDCAKAFGLQATVTQGDD